MIQNKKILMIFLVFIMSLNLSSSTSFILKDNTVVFDEVIKMRDIALMDNVTNRKIGNLVISASPKVGERILIGKKEIYEKLVGNGYKKPVLKGAHNVLVNRSGKTLNTAFFKNKILAYIKKYSKWKSGLSLKIVTTKKIVVPATGVQWKIIPVNGQDFFGNATRYGETIIGRCVHLLHRLPHEKI